MREEGVDRDQRVVDLVRQTRRERAERAEAIRAAHLLARAAQVVDQPRVLDRDHRLVAEALEQRLIVAAEARAAAPVVDRERADHALLPDQRHHQDLVRGDLRHPRRTGPSSSSRSAGAAGSAPRPRAGAPRRRARRGA